MEYLRTTAEQYRNGLFTANEFLMKCADHLASQMTDQDSDHNKFADEIAKGFLNANPPSS